jgi:hypothetical protein
VDFYRHGIPLSPTAADQQTRTASSPLLPQPLALRNPLGLLTLMSCASSPSNRSWWSCGGAAGGRELAGDGRGGLVEEGAVVKKTRSAARWELGLGKVKEHDGDIFSCSIGGRKKNQWASRRECPMHGSYL